MSSEESDVELPKVIPKKTLKKAPKSPTAELLKKQESKEKQENKKISTKEMVHQALVDLKSRKGTSLQAIKKYIEEQYKVDIEKINHFIKKHIKTSVELGTIVQVKGVGASGSFKLAPGKEKSEKKKKSDKKPKKPKETSEQEKPKTKHVKKVESDEKKAATKAKKVEILKSKKVDKKDSDVNKKLVGKEKAVKTKMAKVLMTPAKKRAAMMKRKSIGSIIKPPKMKPKAKA